jgi:hypothetical protein
MSRPPWGDPFDSASEAIDAGYTEGTELRKNGARPEHVVDNIEIYGGQHAGRAFYAEWVKGFRAGHLGERKPAA